MERLQNILVEVLRNSSIAEFAFCSPRSKPSDLWRIGAVLRSVRVETLEHCQSLQQHWHLVQNWISEEYWKLCETSHLSPLHSPPLLQNNICDRKALFRASVSCCTQISQLHFRWSPRTLWQRVPNRVIEFKTRPPWIYSSLKAKILHFEICDLSMVWTTEEVDKYVSKIQRTLRSTEEVGQQFEFFARVSPNCFRFLPSLFYFLDKDWNFRCFISSCLVRQRETKSLSFAKLYKEARDSDKAQRFEFVTITQNINFDVFIFWQHCEDRETCGDSCLA